MERKQIIKYSLIGGVFAAVGVTVYNGMQRNALLKKAATDEDVRLTIALHTLIEGPGIMAELANLISSAGMSLIQSAVAPGTGSASDKIVAMGSQIGNRYEKISGYYKEIFFKNLEKELIVALGPDGFNSFMLRVQGGAAAPGANPSKPGNVMLPPDKYGIPDPYKIPQKELQANGSPVVVAMGKDTGTFWKPDIKQRINQTFVAGDVIGYIISPTAAASSGKSLIERSTTDGVTYTFLLVGNDSFKPTKSWYVVIDNYKYAKPFKSHKAALNSFPNVDYRKIKGNPFNSLSGAGGNHGAAYTNASTTMVYNHRLELIDTINRPPGLYLGAVAQFFDHAGAKYAIIEGSHTTGEVIRFAVPLSSIIISVKHP